jgi:hypothetical protein
MYYVKEREGKNRKGWSLLTTSIKLRRYLGYLRMIGLRAFPRGKDYSDVFYVGTPQRCNQQNGKEIVHVDVISDEDDSLSTTKLSKRN